MLFFYVLQISENPPSAKWERKKNREATSHATETTNPRPPLPLQQVQQLAPTTPAESGRSRRRRGSPIMPAPPHRSSTDLPTLYLPNPCSPSIEAAASTAGGAHACSTERLHGLGSSSSFGGGGARSAASSNDLIVQAQIVPSSRLDFASILFPPSQPQTPNRYPAWTAIFLLIHFHQYFCILSFQ